MTIPHSYIARRRAFAQALEACEQLIRDYEAHKDPGGIVTGHDFNAQEIEAVKTAIVRIQCAEAADRSTGPSHWVSVTERLPNVDELVIAFTDKYGCLLADRTTSNPDHGWSCDGKVTHWMPMPAHPATSATPEG